MPASSQPTNTLSDLLDLIGRDDLPAMEDEDIKGVLRQGVVHALKTHLDLMLSGESERTRAWIAKDWLDRSGTAPVQKVAIKQMITLDPATLEALRAVAEEDDGPGDDPRGSPDQSEK